VENQPSSVIDLTKEISSCSPPKELSEVKVTTTLSLLFYDRSREAKHETSYELSLEIVTTDRTDE
jgi:hypothetical protein